MLDRFSTLERRSTRNEWRLDALDRWRDDIDKRVAVMESKVNDLRFSDAVAEALASKLDDRRRVTFTVMEKTGAGVFALVIVAVPVLLEKLT